MPNVVQQHNVPAAIASVSGFDRPDYVDLFTIPTDGAAGRSPEEWTRAAVDAADLGGQFVWRVLCGLRLDVRPSPDRVGGWTIAGRGDRWIRAEASSWFMTAHLVLYVEDGRLSVATFVRYERPIAAVIWGRLLSAGHRSLMPGLLGATVGRMRRAANGRS
ncbi:MAG TPA: hypothetical protein VFD92_20195 [Candidatus Binatia bacterium]|nr:hypothetical protein [Candidatus Binatia bacterium]